MPELRALMVKLEAMQGQLAESARVACAGVNALHAEVQACRAEMAAMKAEMRRSWMRWDCRSRVRRKGI